MSRAGGTEAARRAHRPTREETLRRLSIVAVATLSMGVALARKEEGNVWLLTGSAALLALVLALATDRERIAHLFRLTPARIARGIGSGIALVVLTHVGYRLFASVIPALPRVVDGLYGDLQDPPGPLFALPVLVLVVVTEEIVWRGLMVDALPHWRKRHRVAILFVATTVYVLPQLGAGNPALLAAAAGCGALWTALRLVTRELVTPTLNHLTWDAVLFYFWPLTI